MSAGGTSRRWEIADAVRKGQPSPKDGGLNGIQRWVMVDLLHRADTATGLIPDRRQPSLDELSSTTGLGTGTLKRAITELRKAGWLEVSRPNLRRPTRYVLTIPAGLSEPRADSLSEPTADPLSEPTADSLDVTGDRGGPSTTRLSEPRADPSEPRAGYESAQSGLTSTSPFSKSSPAAPAAAPNLADRDYEGAVADVMERIDVTDADARHGVAHLLADRSTEVRSVQALIRGSISDDELRAHVLESRREDDDRRHDQERSAVADEQARRHACQVCEADPGEPCTYPDTQAPMPSVHGPRRRAAVHSDHEPPPDHPNHPEPQHSQDNDPLAYECPTCQEPPGHACRKKGGSKTHPERLRLAARGAA